MKCLLAASPCSIISRAVVSLAFICLMAAASTSVAAELLFLDDADNADPFAAQVALAAEFYGVDLDKIAAASPSGVDAAVARIDADPPIGAVISSSAIDVISPELLERLAARLRSNSLPLLVGDLTPGTDPEKLSRLTGSEMESVQAAERAASLIQFASQLKWAHELTGQSVELPAFESLSIHLAPESPFHPLLSIKAGAKDEPVPIAAVRESQEGLRTWLVASSHPADAEEDAQYAPELFYQIAPLMMFVRTEAGDLAWHKPNNFANHTIDDPWLTDPYGNLKYFALLEEMKKVGYHTTIAFIPWNFDRSRPQVVALIKQHPDFFSICVHGNNHDRREFYKYETEDGDPMPARPLEEQEADIRQAVARMESFSKLTGLDYDRIMVFPHGIAPEQTLGLLKKYDFLATVNFRHVPLGSTPPEDDPYFHLRAFTLRYGDLLSYRRSPPNVRPAGEMAVDLFLGNPLLFYTHQIDFSGGVDLVNNTASLVNQLDPAIEWTSLKGVAQGEWRQRRIAENQYEILGFSPDIVVENSSEQPRRYYVHLLDTSSRDYRAVLVGEKPVEYERSEAGVSFSAEIPPGQTRRIRIDYRQETDFTQVAVAKDDRYANILRRVSDFRDITLTTNPVGVAINSTYYGTGLYRLGLKRLAVLVIALMGGVAVLVVYFRRRRQRARLQLS